MMKGIRKLIVVFSLLLSLLGGSVMPAAAAPGSSGKLYVFHCQFCAGSAIYVGNGTYISGGFGHTAVVFYDSAHDNYRFLSWEAGGNLVFNGNNYGLGEAYPRLVDYTVNTWDELLRVSNYWPYNDYKVYELSADQVNGLRSFLWYSAWTSPNPPTYNFISRNCAHFTWAAMIASNLNPSPYYGDPNSWFGTLSGEVHLIRR